MLTDEHGNMISELPLSMDDTLRLIKKYSNKVGLIESYVACQWWNGSEQLAGLKAAFNLPFELHSSVGDDAISQVVEFLADLESMVLTPFSNYRTLDPSYRFWLDSVLRTFDLCMFDIERPIGPGAYAYTSMGLCAAMYGMVGEVGGMEGTQNEGNRQMAAQFIRCWREAIARLMGKGKNGREFYESTPPQAPPPPGWGG